MRRHRLPRVRPARVGERRRRAGRSTRGCGRRARRRCAARAATPCGRAPPACAPVGYAASSRGVRVVPLVDQAGRGVRGAAQRVVVHRPLPRRHPVDLPADADHRVDEPVDLGEVLALGGLHHQRARHRERHRRRVQAVVGQPLGDVVDGHAGRLRDPPQVEDALVGHPARRPRVEHRVVLRQPRGDVVGRRHGRERRPPQPVEPHQPQVRPRDRQHARAAVRAPPTRARPTPARRAGTAPGARPPRPGPTPGPAAAVRDAERLVQVEVAHVAAERARPGHARPAR